MAGDERQQLRRANSRTLLAMAHGRGQVVVWSASVATIGGGFAAFVASQVKTPFDNPLFLGLATVAGLAFLILLAAGLPDLAAWLSSELHDRPRRYPPVPLIADRWVYTADGIYAATSMSLWDQALPGTNYMTSPGERLPWVRVIVVIGCDTMSDDAKGSDLWNWFVTFLEAGPVTSLLGELASESPDARWRQWATNRKSLVDAVLTPNGEEDAVAAARLDLPDERHVGSPGPRWATFMLHVEPPRRNGKPMPAAGPSTWERRLATVLEMPEKLAAALRDGASLRTSGEPAVQVGVRLEAQEDLAELVDIGGLERLPGGTKKPQAIGYFLGQSAGKRAGEAAHEMVTHVLRYGLHVEGSD